MDTIQETPEFVLTPEQEALEDRLYKQMKESPEWDVLPKPARWYKKYNIPPMKVLSTAEVLNSDYHNKVKLIPRTLPPIIYDKPQRDGYTWPLQEVKDELTFTLQQKPFEGTITFDVEEARKILEAENQTSQS
jgi:hypothetical protein